MGIYIQYIYRKTTIVVLASEPVGGRSRATELPCLALPGLFGVIDPKNCYIVMWCQIKKITTFQKDTVGPL